MQGVARLHREICPDEVVVGMGRIQIPAAAGRIGIPGPVGDVISSQVHVTEGFDDAAVVEWENLIWPGSYLGRNGLIFLMVC